MIRMRQATNRWIFAGLASIALMGCQEFTRSDFPTQSILIDTGDVTDATCIVEAGLIKVQFSATPGIMRMPMSREDMKITCTKPGYEPAERTYENTYRMFVPEPVVERSLGRPELQRPTPVAGYPEIVRIAMVPLPPPQPPGAPTSAPPSGPTPLTPITTVAPTGGAQPDFQPIIRLAPPPATSPAPAANPSNANRRTQRPPTTRPN